MIILVFHIEILKKFNNIPVIKFVFSFARKNWKPSNARRNYGRRITSVLLDA